MRKLTRTTTLSAAELSAAQAMLQRSRATLCLDAIHPAADWRRCAFCAERHDPRLHVHCTACHVSLSRAAISGSRLRAHAAHCTGVCAQRDAMARVRPARATRRRGGALVADFDEDSSDEDDKGTRESGASDAPDSGTGAALPWHVVVPADGRRTAGAAILSPEMAVLKVRPLQPLRGRPDHAARVSRCAARARAHPARGSARSAWRHSAASCRRPLCAPNAYWPSATRKATPPHATLRRRACGAARPPPRPHRSRAA